MLIVICFSLAGCIPEPPGREEAEISARMYYDFIYLKPFNEYGIWDWFTYPHRMKVIKAGDLDKILDEITPKEGENVNLLLYIYDNYGRGDMILAFARRDLAYHNINRYKTQDGCTNLLYNLSYLLNLPIKIGYNIYWDACIAMHPIYYVCGEEGSIGLKNCKCTLDYILLVAYYIISIILKILLFIYFVICDFLVVIIGIFCAILMVFVGTIMGFLADPGGTIMGIIPSIIPLVVDIVRGILSFYAIFYLLWISVKVLCFFGNCTCQSECNHSQGEIWGIIRVPSLSEEPSNENQIIKRTGIVLGYSLRNRKTQEFWDNLPQCYEPLSNAKISIEQRNICTPRGGCFSFKDLPIGRNILKVEHPDFISLVQEIVITDPNFNDKSPASLNIIPKQVLMQTETIIHFAVYGITSTGNYIKVPKDWTVAGDIGTVSNDGIFAAIKSGSGTIKAINNNLSVEANITVVDSVGTIKGVFSHNNSPVKNVEVHIENTNLYTITDREGKYTIPGVPATEVTVKINSSEFKDCFATVVVKPLEEVTADIVCEDK